jgi:hypothetical protein
LVQMVVLIVGFIIAIILAINYQKMLPYLDAYTEWAADQAPTW